VLPEEVAAHVAAFRALQAESAVNPQKIGFVGLSATGSIAMVAAADPGIRDEVWLVLALGTYFDAASLIAAVVSGEYRTDRGLTAWQPEQLTSDVIRQTLLATLENADRDALETGSQPPGDAGRIVGELLDGPGYERAEALLARFDGRQTAMLHRISARFHVSGLRAPLYLIHDRADRFIPWVESERLASVYPPRAYLRLDLLEHAQPRLSAVLPLLKDGWRLQRLMVDILDGAFP